MTGRPRADVVCRGRSRQCPSPERPHPRARGAPGRALMHSGPLVLGQLAVHCRSRDPLQAGQSAVRGGIVKSKIIDREALRVAYTISVGDPATSDAFVRLEQVVPLRGNRFFATFDVATREYRACVALKAGEVAEQYGLPEAILPGRKYAQTGLVGTF